MSERTKTNVVVLILAGFVIGCVCYWDGKQAGRAQQKKEDAAWYQSHPVVKEVPVALKPGECIIK